MEDTFTVTIDATVTVTVDGSGTSGTVSGTKTSEGVSVVEGIFSSGMTMDVDGNTIDQWDNRPVGTTYYGEGTVSLDDTFGITVPSKEELLARLREAVATKVRIETIMAHDPDVGANLASQLTDIETSIADLEAAAADAGATAEEIATAKSAGAADAASFDPANYVRNVHLIRGNADEVDWDWDGFKQGFWAGSGEVNYWLATPVRWLIDDVDSFYSRARDRNWGATDLEGSWTQSITQATAAGGAGAIWVATGLAALPAAASSIVTAAGNATLPYRVAPTLGVLTGRFFVTATQYRAVVSRSVFAPLVSRLGLHWHHWAIPNSVGRAAGGGLNRLAQAGWNLIPMHAGWNMYIGNSGFWFNVTRVGVGTSPVTVPWGIFETVDWLLGDEDEGE